MSSFVLIPGAGGMGWYWHRVVDDLTRRGHHARAVDLPGADPTAGLPEYREAVIDAIGGAADVVLVAQSLGAFTAAAVGHGVAVPRIVLVNAMIPLPGETPGEWWVNTRSEEARVAAARAGGYPEAFDEEHYFLHDLPSDEIAALQGHYRPEADIVFGQPFQIDRWPDIPTTVIAAREDRFFPLDFQQRIARDRLGRDVEPVPGGHLAALSYPGELVDRLVGN